MTTTPQNFEERLVQVLREGGFVEQRQIDQARAKSKETGKGMLDTFIDQGILTKETLTAVLSMQMKIGVVNLMHVQINREAVKLVPEEYARERQVIPIDFDSMDGSLRIATKTPNDFKLSAELSAMTGRQVKFVLAIGGEITEMINRVYATMPVQKQGSVAQAPGTAAVTAITPAGATSPGALLDQGVSQLPTVQAVDMVTLQAVKGRASDIHLVPDSDSARVLFRRDGVLQKMTVLPLTLLQSMISRIKVQAGMDIAESRRPQDGAFSMTFGERKVDFRVSCIGTIWGEMMVIRILDRSQGLFSLEDLGLESMSLLMWRQLLALPHGMMLVSGPTGAGKTTTLYASVAELINDRGNIMAVEDPVEYHIEGINQIQVNRAAGIDFPVALRSIMRLDPDIILVGEIRDAETAATAVKAALTGHLVLASIHSNDAAASLVRLLDLGVEGFLASTSLLGALAQRLVRKICTQCRVLAEPTATEAMAYEQEMKELPEKLWVGRGCNFCEGTGFSGRTGVFEAMVVDEPIRKLISAGASGQEIRMQAMADGMISLRRAGMMKVKEGQTTLSEVFKNVFID